jgi:hypothetical protein
LTDNETENSERYVNKKSRRLRCAVGLLSTLTAIFVFTSLTLPAFSQTGANPSLTSENAEVSSGESVAVEVGASVEAGENDTVFLLAAKDGGAVLADKYAFSSDVAQVTDEDGNAVELHRVYTDAEAPQYWFGLTAGQSARLNLDFVQASVTGEMASINLRGVSAPTLTEAQTALSDDETGSTLSLSWTGTDTAGGTSQTNDAAAVTADSAASGGSSPTLTAQSDDTGISGYTIYYDKANEAGYYVMEGGVRKTVYCYNHELMQPSSSGTSGYTRYDYFSDAAPLITYTEDGYNTPYPKTKQQVAGLLYAGYPVDGAGYITKYGESTSGGYDATYHTQAALWVFARDPTPTPSTYYTAVYAYGANTTGSPYGHTGDVSITGDGTVTQVNGVYRSGTYTVSGSFDGAFWFDSLPDNVTVHSASTGEAMTSLKSGDSFYFEITGTPQATLSLSYTYLDSTVYYYAGSAVVSAADATSKYPAGSKYQNFIRMEAEKHSAALSLTYTSPPGDTTGPKTTVTVTKSWSDGADTHTADPVTVRLFADGTSVGASATLNASNSWTYTFSGLPYYRSDGTTPITYSVQEDAVAGYTTSYKTTSTTGPTVTVSTSSTKTFENGKYYSISTGTGGYAMAVKYSGGAYSLVSKAYDSSDTSQLWKAVSGPDPEGYNGSAPGGWFYLENVKYPGEWLYFYYSSSDYTGDEKMELSSEAKTTFTISSTGKLYTMHYYSGSYGAGWYYKSVTVGQNSVSFAFVMEGNTIPGTTLTYKSATISDGSTAITVTNSSEGYTLPDTGGSGLLPFIFWSAALILLPTAVFTAEHIGKKRGGGSHKH